MAQTMICDGCGEREAVVMITQVGTGEIQAFDPWCAITWFETAAAIMRDQLGMAPAGQEAERSTDVEHTADDIPPAEVGPDLTDQAASLVRGADTAKDPTSTASGSSGATMGAGQPARADARQEG